MPMNKMEKEIQKCNNKSREEDCYLVNNAKLKILKTFAHVLWGTEHICFGGERRYYKEFDISL